MSIRLMISSRILNTNYLTMVIANKNLDLDLFFFFLELIDVILVNKTI